MNELTSLENKSATKKDRKVVNLYKEKLSDELAHDDAIKVAD